MRSPRWSRRYVDGAWQKFRQIPAPAVAVYVRADYRRRGLGTRLLRAAARTVDEVWTLPHSRPSRAFLTACFPGRHVQDLGEGFGWVVSRLPEADDPFAE